MIRLALVALAIAGLSACSMQDALSRDCSPVDVTPYTGHVDYSHGTWWDTETGRVIGYSLSEDSDVLTAGCSL